MSNVSCQVVMSLLLIALFLYPFWGLALLLWLCWWLRLSAPLAKRLLVSIVVACVATLLFAPAMWGTEGFAFMVPWYFAFVDRQHTSFVWPLAAFVYALSLVANVVSGGVHRSHPPQVKPQ